MAHVDLLEMPLNALKERAAELEQLISESSKAITSHVVSSLWQRWTHLRSVARAQERALEDTAREWRNFNEKVRDSLPVGFCACYWCGGPHVLACFLGNKEQVPTL